MREESSRLSSCVAPFFCTACRSPSLPGQPKNHRAEASGETSGMTRQKSARRVTVLVEREQSPIYRGRERAAACFRKRADITARPTESQWVNDL